MRSDGHTARLASVGRLGVAHADHHHGPCPGRRGLHGHGRSGAERSGRRACPHPPAGARGGAGDRLPRPCPGGRGRRGIAAGGSGLHRPRRHQHVPQCAQPPSSRGRRAARSRSAHRGAPHGGVRSGEPGGRAARACRVCRRRRPDRARPPRRAHRHPRGGGDRHAHRHAGLRHFRRAAARLCRHRQPRRRPARRPSARALPAAGPRLRRDVRGLAALSRPRGTRLRLPPHPGRGVPRPDAAGNARDATARRRPCSPARPTSPASTMSAPATGASCGRWRRPGGCATWW